MVVGRFEKVEGVELESNTAEMFLGLVGLESLLVEGAMGTVVTGVVEEGGAVVVAVDAEADEVADVGA